MRIVIERRHGNLRAMNLKTPRDFGLLVRDRRKKHRLTQDDFAKRLGVSRLWVIHLEQGKPTVQLDLVLRALNDLGISLTLDDDPQSFVLREKTAQQFDDIIQGTLKRPKP